MNDEPAVETTQRVSALLCPLASGSELSTLNPQLSTRAHVRARGFTLLELLTVMGIIAILAGIVLGVGRRANESGKIARAKVELAALSNALEAYKTQYGDYPQTNDSPRLLQSLIGKVGPTGVPIANGRAQIESAKFNIANPLTPDAPLDPFVDAAAVLLDPWGGAYLYSYGTKPAWKNSSFVLLSAGPDGAATLPIPSDGIIDALYDNAQQGGRAINTDNLYANRN